MYYPSISFGAAYTVGSGQTYTTFSGTAATSLLHTVNLGADDTVAVTSNISDDDITWTSADAGTAGHPVVVDLGGFTIDASGGTSGILFAAGANYVTIQNGVLDGGDSASSHGIKLASANSGTLIGITLSDLEIKDFGDDGISSNLTSTGLVHTIVIDDCTISGNGDSGIQALHPAGVFHTWTITDTTITGNTAWGIRVYHTSESRDCYGFTIGSSGHGNTITNNGGPGVVLRAFTDTAANSVCYNTVTGNGKIVGTVGGIWFMDCYGVTCDYNTVGDNGTTGIDGVGIYFDNRCDSGCSARYNWIYGHNDDDADIEPPTEGHLTCAAGVSITNADNITFENNIIFDNFVGARLGASGSASAVIQNNTFVNNEFANVKLQNSFPAPTLQNNIFYGGKYGVWEDANDPNPESDNCYYGASVDADYGFTKNAGTSVTTDPLFYDVDNDDFELQAGSGCVNTGTTGATYGISPGSSWNDSVSLLTRSTFTPDIGAYEAGYIVSVVETDTTASEAGPATGTLTFSCSPNCSNNVDYTLQDSTATVNTDYNATDEDGTVSISGATLANVITPVDDSDIESTETVVMAVSRGSGYTPGTTNSGIVYITDNDDPSPPISGATITLSGGSNTITMTGGSLTITISPNP